MHLPDPQSDPQFYAGVPIRRLIAFVIDLVVILGLIVPVMVLAAVLSVITFGLGSGLGVAMTALTGFFYRWATLAVFGATAGMRLMGIELRDGRGERPTTGLAFVHTVAFHVVFFFPPLMLVGWILMLTSPYRRLLHDLPLGSAMINRPI